MKKYHLESKANKVTIVILRNFTSRYNHHFIFLLWLGLALAPFARAQNQSSENAQTVQGVFQVGFKNGHFRSVDEACLVASNEWLRFCREGFFASRVGDPFVLENFCGFKISGPLEGRAREQYLAYGIGAGYRSEPLTSHAESTKSCFQGRRKYFLDGLAMGFVLFLSHHNLDLAKAIDVCSRFDDLDRKVCSFGLGRGLFFVQNSLNEKQFQNLKATVPGVQDGFDFAEIFAGRRLRNNPEETAPGVFAALNLLEEFELPIEGTRNRKKFRQCLAHSQEHHYLCALQILRPEQYFIGR